MVGLEFLDYLTKFHATPCIGVDDLPDKLNFLFTVIVLLICMLIVTVKQYVLKPISCYFPTNIGGINLHAYIENYCWVQGTIALTDQATIPTTENGWKELENTKILYYQWVPFMLGLQCIMFYIPKLIWQIICYNQTGTDIQHLITSANQAVHSIDEARSKMVVYLSKTMEQILYQHREYSNGKWARLRSRIHNWTGFFLCSKRIGTRLITTYLILKLTYISNGFLQLFIMQKFLGFTDLNILKFGSEVTKNILSGTDWKTTLIFPRVTYCLINVNQLGTRNSIIAQCALPVNMLNERIYFFLWCWILIVLGCTIFSIPIWIMRVMCIKFRQGFIRKYLLICEIVTKDKNEMKTISKFENQFLRHDGVFLLKMISLNAGDVITAEIVCQLWFIFKSNYINRNFLNDESDTDEEKDVAMIRLSCQSNSFADKNTPTAPYGS